MLCIPQKSTYSLIRWPLNLSFQLGHSERERASWSFSWEHRLTLGLSGPSGCVVAQFFKDFDKVSDTPACPGAEALRRESWGSSPPLSGTSDPKPLPFAPSWVHTQHPGQEDQARWGQQAPEEAPWWGPGPGLLPAGSTDLAATQKAF